MLDIIIDRDFSKNSTVYFCFSEPAKEGARTALARARNIADLRLMAQKRLPRMVFDYMDGGAEDEIALARNTKGGLSYAGTGTGGATTAAGGITGTAGCAGKAGSVGIVSLVRSGNPRLGRPGKPTRFTPGM